MRFLFVIVISFFIMFGLWFIDYKSTMMQSIDSLQKDSYRYNQLLDNIVCQYHYNNQTLNKEIPMVSQKGDTVIIGNVLDNNKLAICFNGTKCRTCLDLFYSYIKKIKPYIMSVRNNCIVIIDSNNLLDKKVISDYVQCDTYHVLTNELSIKQNDLSIPLCFFIITNEGMIKNLFIPIEKDNKIWISYFESIKGDL